MTPEESPEVPFGRGPMMDVVADLRAWNEMPQAERVAASARFVEEKIRSGEWAD